MLFFYQTIIKFPWWSTMSRNSTIMLTYYAWPPNPLFDAIEFISTGSRSLLVYFCFVFFSKNCGSRNFFPSIVEVFFPEKYVLEYYHYVLVWIPFLTSETLWLKSRACHQTISNLKPFLIEVRSLCHTRDFGQIKTAFAMTAWWNRI